MIFVYSRNIYINIYWLRNAFEWHRPYAKMPLNYSFVHIQNNLTNLARDNKFFNKLLKNEVGEAILNTEQKNNLKAAIFA